MPIKDIMRTYICKHCGKSFVMFKDPDGKLIYYPDNVMWPTHGDFELISHMKNAHRHKYDMFIIFEGHNAEKLIGENYDEKLYM